jgi:hypothetical protein
MHALNPARMLRWQCLGISGPRELDTSREACRFWSFLMQGVMVQYIQVPTLSIRKGSPSPGLATDASSDCLTASPTPQEELTTASAG